MIEKVVETIKENSMIKKGDKIIIGVSGGPDSMCLLNILYSLRDKLNLTLYVAHVNHCIRGKDADNDELYVKEYCEKRNIKFFALRVDVNALAKEKNISSETAGRQVRYGFFEELKEKFSAQKIALAHNANDNAETIIMRLMRGTGIEGIIGIKPVRDEIFIRPLIKSLRSEIEKYCEEHKLFPHIDKTNLETIYTRNKIRLELIPYIQKNLNQNVIGSLNRLSHIVTKDNEYLEQVSEEKYKKYSKFIDKTLVLEKDAFNEHEAILSRIIRKALMNIVGHLCNFERIHIYDIINLQAHETGKSIDLPFDIIAENVYGNIHIYKFQKQKSILNNKKEYPIHINNITHIEDEYIVKTRVIDKCEEIDLNDRYAKYFDVEKMDSDKIILRYRKSGDKIKPFGMNGTRKLKNIFMDLKIPKEKRDEIPLICFEDEIAWIVGYRISNDFKIDKNTKSILEIKIERRE